MTIRPNGDQFHTSPAPDRDYASEIENAMRAAGHVPYRIFKFRRSIVCLRGHGDRCGFEVTLSAAEDSLSFDVLLAAIGRRPCRLSPPRGTVGS